MFVRKKKNRSGSVSVVVVDKSHGRFSEIRQFGVAHTEAEARHHVRSFFSGGNGPYYRVHHGENMLSPEQQDAIMKIIGKFGSTEGIRFDHYVMAWDFG